MKNMTTEEVGQMKKKPSDIVRETYTQKGYNGEDIDPFDLHAVIFVGNTVKGVWDISANYRLHLERSIGIDPDQFDADMNDEIWGETDEEKILERYREELEETMKGRLF